MSSKQNLTLLLFVLALLPGACTTSIDYPQSTNRVSSCHIVYDAGSSGTRLYVYEQTPAGWLRHRGPTTGPLADPVRALQGKDMSDASNVVDEIIQALDSLRHDGPLESEGQAAWPAFDWQQHCSIETAAVYATAGMRLAEQENAEASELVWKYLNDKLSTRLGMTVTTRTISGYEEGLFAWLAIREGRDNGIFGVAEMGGVSIQITFPCPECATSRRVMVKGRVETVYSHSFLGWGQDEVWRKSGPIPACEAGVGKDNPNWRVSDCVAGVAVLPEIAIDIAGTVRRKSALRWYLGGAFFYMKETDIDQFCRKGRASKFEPESACFRAVYLNNVIARLGFPPESEPADVDWTLGAAVCTATHCLEIQ